LIAGRPAPQGRTDSERLITGELLYRGWRRTPLCALIGEEGAAEFYATTLDVYVYLGVVEGGESRNTADGRPTTKEASGRRLARMLLGDLETTTHEQRQHLANLIHVRLTSQIALAIKSVARAMPGPVGCILTSGSGEFLIPMVLGSMVLGNSSLARVPVLSVTKKFTNVLSISACALAVAVLCAEQE